MPTLAPVLRPEDDEFEVALALPGRSDEVVDADAAAVLTTAQVGSVAARCITTPNAHAVSPDEITVVVGATCTVSLPVAIT